MQEPDVAAAIALKQQPREARQTPEQAATRAAILASLPRVSLEEIEADRSPRGGWTKATLAGWGVPWPAARWLAASPGGCSGTS